MTDSEQQDGVNGRFTRRRFVAGTAGAFAGAALLTGQDAEAAIQADTIFASAGDLAASIRTGEYSSEELVSACLERIGEVNPKLNAVIRLDAEGALAQARRADAMLARDDDVGPLHGVPMTIKDSLDTAGMVSTAATKGRENYVPERDATVVARLREAGARCRGSGGRYWLPRMSVAASENMPPGA